ncbi:hypothetical protein NP233_g4105 [Leucocoprinus birnbaumii]|uniref:NADPH oxidase regulator NoxR n=1 Tax=Leucocoprinus birnbaumii TaxID=56174 RepID=A0AAD5VVC3_9AGAR|nr:hypothetical protein NP233_g4105 [Leucocoprinus birnbaumii]
MSLKAELETWAAALKAYDEQDFEKALDLFSRIADSSKILTNMGLIYATLGEHEAAVERFIEATNLDQYLAVAYFQCGVSNFLLTRYDLAFKDFEQALFYLRGNQAINYEQLGLKFRLFSAEVLYNKGLSLIYLGRMEEGMQDMQEASRDKAIDDHKVIDEAIRDRGEGYMVFSVPVGVLYRPSEKKLKNAAARDFLGEPILVAASDATDAFTTFTGSTRLKQGISPSGVYVDQFPEANVSRSATLPTVTPGTRTMVDTPPSTVERAKTTLAVPSNAREFTNPNNRGPSSPNNDNRSAEPGLARSATQITPGKPSPGVGIGGPVRGLSVRRPNDAPAPVSLNDSGPAPPPKAPKQKEARLTEFYDDYLDSYADTASAPAVPKMPVPVTSTSNDRVAAWAKGNANGVPPPGMSRNGSRSAPGSTYAPSSYGGTSMRRKSTRRGPPRGYRMQSTYEEDEEEGYVSGDYDDGYYELVKIRVKIHHGDEVRGMAVTPDMPFEEFMDKLAAKFDTSIRGLGLKFQDEDGGKVTLADESDYELAIETARTGSKGKAEDAARFGTAYLSKFGWDSSKGLGVSGDGRTSHIKVSQKLDMMGIGAAHQKDPNGIAWKQNKDYENLLKRLNEANGVDGGEGQEEKNVVDGEKRERKKERKERKEKEKKEKKEEKEEKKEKESTEKEGKERKKKRKRDEDVEDSDKKSKKKKTDTPEPVQSKPTSPEPAPSAEQKPTRVVPRHRSHRARHIAAKSISSKSAAAIAEILGIAPSPSLSSSATPSGTQTPQEGKLTSVYDDTPDDEKITTSTKSVQDYFKEKMGKLKGLATTVTSIQSEVDYDDVPRGGLGSRPRLMTEDEDAPRIGLSKFSALMSSTYMTATSLSSMVASETPAEKTVGEKEERRRRKKEKKEKKEGSREDRR